MSLAYTFAQSFDPAPARTFKTPRHYLLYATKGALRLEAQGQRWSLPPARAALITAQTPIIVSLTQPVTTCSVLFDADLVPAPAKALAVFEMSSLARELIVSTRQWSQEDGQLDDYATALFRALAAVTWRLAQTPSPAVMPTGRSEALRMALEITATNLEHPMTFESLASQVALSPRSLARRFSDELGMTWRQAQRRLRMIRAIEMLAQHETPITEVAFLVGYQSLSSFNKAFRDFTGLTPTEYRASF